MGKVWVECDVLEEGEHNYLVAFSGAVVPSGLNSQRVTQQDRGCFWAPKSSCRQDAIEKIDKGPAYKVGGFVKVVGSHVCSGMIRKVTGVLNDIHGQFYYMIEDFELSIREDSLVPAADPRFVLDNLDRNVREARHRGAVSSFQVGKVLDVGDLLVSRDGPHTFVVRDESQGLFLVHFLANGSFAKLLTGPAGSPFAIQNTGLVQLLAVPTNLKIISMLKAGECSLREALCLPSHDHLRSMLDNDRTSAGLMASRTTFGLISVLPTIVMQCSKRVVSQYTVVDCSFSTLDKLIELVPAACFPLDGVSLSDYSKSDCLGTPGSDNISTESQKLFEPADIMHRSEHEPSKDSLPQEQALEGDDEFAIPRLHCRLAGLGARIDSLSKRIELLEASSKRSVFESSVNNTPVDLVRQCVARGCSLQEISDTLYRVLGDSRTQDEVSMGVAHPFLASNLKLFFSPVSVKDFGKQCLFFVEPGLDKDAIPVIGVIKGVENVIDIKDGNSFCGTASNVSYMSLNGSMPQFIGCCRVDKDSPPRDLCSLTTLGSVPMVLNYFPDIL